MSSRPELVSSVPPCLQPIKKYLARAEELSRQSASDASFSKIACLTRMAATEMGIDLLKSLSPEEQAAAGAYLGQLMDSCETDKASLGMSSDSKAADLDLVRIYALSVFKAADDADRAGAPDMSTSRRFIVSGLLLDVHKQLMGADGVLPQLEQMAKFAKARGMDIKTCLESGRVPPPAGAVSSAAPADEGAAAGGPVPMELVASSVSAPATASGGYSDPSILGMHAAAGAASAGYAIPTAQVYSGAPPTGIPTAMPVASPYPQVPYATGLPPPVGVGAAASVSYPVPVPVAPTPPPAPAPSAAARATPLPAYSAPPVVIPAMPPQYASVVGKISAGLGDMHLGRESTGADAFQAALHELQSFVSSMSFTVAMGAVHSALSMRDGRMTNDRVQDAAEHARFAVAALRYSQPEMAVNNLREALAELGHAA